VCSPFEPTSRFGESWILGLPRLDSILEAVRRLVRMVVGDLACGWVAGELPQETSEHLAGVLALDADRPVFEKHFPAVVVAVFQEAAGGRIADVGRRAAAGAVGGAERAV